MCVISTRINHFNWSRHVTPDKSTFRLTNACDSTSSHTKGKQSRFIEKQHVQPNENLQPKATQARFCYFRYFSLLSIAHTLTYTHFQLKFNINNLRCYNLWALFVFLSTKCAYEYVSINWRGSDWKFNQEK